jgi:hypothetical protein
MINWFPVDIGRICLVSAIKNILNYYGCNLNESELYGLCEGHLFYFGGLANQNECDLKGKNMLREIRMGSMKYNLEELLERLESVLNLDIEKYPFRSEEEVRQLIEYYIQKKMPVLSLVLRKYLSYTPKDKADNISHAITVIGYDWNKNVVEIADNYIPTIPVSKYVGSLDFAHYLASFDLSKAVFEMKSENRIIAVNPRKDFRYQLDPLHKKNALAHIAKQNLEGGVIDSDIIVGIDGIKRFKEEIFTWQNNYSPKLLKDIYMTLHNLITNFAGPYVSFDLLGNICMDLYQATNEKTFQRMANQAEKIKKNWLLIGNLCAKAANLLEDKSIYKRIVNYLDIIIEMEEVFYTELLAI